MAYILSSQNVRIDQQSASIGARTGAILLDLFVMGSIEYAITQLGVYILAYDNATVPLFIILKFLPVFYPLLCEIFWDGQTAGKRACNIRVVTLEGGGPKVTALILRWLMLPFDLIGAMGLGELCIFFTKRQQRLGDLIAGTWVVKTKTYTTENLTLDDYAFPTDYSITYPKAKNLKPSQAALIDEVIEAAQRSKEVQFALLDFSRKVQQIAGESQESSDLDYLTKVLNDYRY